MEEAIFAYELQALLPNATQLQSFTAPSENDSLTLADPTESNPLCVPNIFLKAEFRLQIYLNIFPGIPSHCIDNTQKQYVYMLVDSNPIYFNLTFLTDPLLAIAMMSVGI